MFALLLLMSSATAPLPEAAPPPPNKDKAMTCHMRKPTGTRFAKKVCTYRKDAEARADRDQAAMKAWVDADQPNPPEGPPR